MTDEVPDWASDDVPWAPVHQEQQDQLQRPFTQQELQEFGKQFIEQFLRRVVLAVAGSFLPDEAAFDQLRQWAQNIPFVGDIINFIKTTTGIDLSSPQALITSLGNLIANGGKLPSVFSISRIGDIVQDLINGAGAFLNADSVSPGSPWSWDSVMPGWKTGGSIRATANGTQQVLRADEVFEVFENQTLKIKDAAARWTGATAAAGSNPIKVGWTPYDADGNAMADVIKGTLQPSGDSAGWVPFTVSDWTVPAGVSHATTLVILDSGATAGNVWVSNVLPYAAQLGDKSLIKDLPEDLQDLADGIADNVVALATKLAQGDFDGFLSALMNGGATTPTAITNKFQFLNSAGKFDVTQLLGLLAQNQVTGLPDMNTALNQIGDIFNGAVVTPINSIVLYVRNWYTANANTTQGLSSDLSSLQHDLATSADSVIGNINSVVVDGTHTVQNLLDQLGQAFGGASSGNTTATAAAQAQQTAAQAEAAATQAAALAAWFAAQQQDAVAPTGLNFNTSFGGSNGSALNTSDWQSQSNIVNVGTYGYMGLASGVAAGSTYSVYGKHACTTQNQRISITLGDQGAKSTMPLIVCWFTGATSFAGGACLQIANNGVTFGYMNGGGSLTSWASWSGSLGQGANITAYNVGNAFVVQINGVAQMAYTDSGNVVTYTNTGQFVFMGRTSSTNWLGQVTLYDSFRIAGYGLADYNPGGSGTVDSWLLTRSSTSVVSVSPSSGAASALPSGFLTATTAISGASVNTLGTGVITIAKTGWYDLNAGIPAQTTMGNVGPTAQSNMAASPWCVIVNGSQVTGPLHGTIRLKLNSGDNVQPAYFAEPVGNFVWYRSATTNSQLSDVNKISGLAGFAHWSGVLVGT